MGKGKTSRFENEPSPRISNEIAGHDTCIDSWKLSRSHSQTSAVNVASINAAAPVDMVIKEYSDEFELQ